MGKEFFNFRSLLCVPMAASFLMATDGPSQAQTSGGDLDLRDNPTAHPDDELSRTPGRILSFGGAAEFSYYGQISPAWQSVDDGVKTYSLLVDNDNSNTRLGINYAPRIFDLPLTFHFETSFGGRSSNSVSQNSVPGLFDDAFVQPWDESRVRKLELIFDTEYGFVTIGQGSMATDGVAEVNKSQTTIASASNLANAAGGYYFRTEDGELSEVVIGDVFRNLDGSRRMRFRFDSPAFRGMTFSASVGKEVLSENDNREFADIALRFGFESGDFDIDGAAGWSRVNYDDRASNDQFMGSVSMLHVPTGLNATYASGIRDSEGWYGYLNLGWITDFWETGHTTMSVDYYHGEQIGERGGDSHSVGGAIVQKFDKQSSEVFVGYRNYSYDDSGDQGFLDMSSLMMGLRFKF